jgi:hypothetical protein
MPNRQYALVVDGELSDELSKWFAGMPPPRKVGGLHGQAELRGLLQRIAKLGHALLSASTTDEEEHAVDGVFGRETAGTPTEPVEGAS